VQRACLSQPSQPSFRLLCLSLFPAGGVLRSLSSDQSHAACASVSSARAAAAGCINAPEYLWCLMISPLSPAA
jgi:hypothetical protein